MQVPVEASPSTRLPITNTVSSQSSHHSNDSLDGAEASKVLTLVESFLLLSFYPYQKSIIDAVVDMKSTIVIQSTGNVKNLCFQFPCLVLDANFVRLAPIIINEGKTFGIGSQDLISDWNHCATMLATDFMDLSIYSNVVICANPNHNFSITCLAK